MKRRTISKKKPKKKKTVKRRLSKKLNIRTPTAINHKVRACIAEEIASAKGRKKLSRREKRLIFDKAFHDCLKKNR